jgi:hypothetical protein
MLTVEELPIAIQTIFADLVHRAWTGNLSALTSQGGSAYAREARGRLYWYWQPPTAPDGNRPSAKYIGPDNDQTRAHLQQLKDHVENLRQRPAMVLFFKGLSFDPITIRAEFSIKNCFDRAPYSTRAEDDLLDHSSKSILCFAPLVPTIQGLPQMCNLLCVKFSGVRWHFWHAIRHLGQ